MTIRNMKEIKAFIKPNRLKQVVNGLKENGFDSITLSKAEGTGSHRSPDAFPSLDFKITDSPIVKLELVCNDEKVAQIVSIISEKGRSLEPGDGLIYVSHVEGAYKVKTGDSISDF
jgi:nitrogen regulatory protein P-II 1